MLVSRVSPHSRQEDNVIIGRRRPSPGSQLNRPTLPERGLLLDTSKQGRIYDLAIFRNKPIVQIQGVTMKSCQRLRAAALLLTLSLIGSAAARGNGFSIEQVLASPFPSDLIASPKGDKVAWIFDAQGRRNIWVAEAPAFRGRQLTRYQKDDGQELSSPVFSPDGSLIAYVHGGEGNIDKEIPNPTSDPGGAKQEVLVVNVHSGAVTTIGEGSSPAFTPNGDRILFNREGQLWVAPAPAAGRTRSGSARKLFEVRGEVDSPAWSPDGSRLAFSSARGDHGFIAIYEPKAGRIRFVQPGVDRDIEPRWSPDGKRIAFIRLFNIQDTFSPDHERIIPWSIWVVEATTGLGREIWKSGTGEADSFARLPLGQNILQWAGSDRLVFASEKDGWAHLYSISDSGGEAICLTPGSFEVENVAWAPDRSHLVFSTNARDIDRRHLWDLNVADGSMRPITRGNGIEMYPLLIEGGRRAAYLGSSAREPLLPYIAEADGSSRRPLAPQASPDGFPSDQLVEPEQVIIKAADGMEIHCQLFKAANASPRARAIVFMHGGPIRQMLLGWHYGYYYHNAYAFNQYLASRGYVVLSVNYRSGVGYGRAFREAKHRGPRGASEYQDIVAAGRYLKSRSDVDGKRIGLWGGSYGGYLTAMGLARDSDLFAAGVDLHGVHDWTARVGRTPWATGSSELIKLGKESSPISSVDKWKSPVLLIHGDDDRNVAFNQTVELVRKLRERGVSFEELVFPDEVHDFLRHDTWLRAYRAASEFFDRVLR
jgi:dipeptidyl aminopeptidase/acylaminoacyl peptidase